MKYTDIATGALMAEDAVRICMQPDDLSLETLPELDGDLTN